METSMVMIWLILTIILAVFEVISTSLTSIWFACGALIACGAAAIGLPLAVQIVVFIVVSVAILLTVRPLAVKYFNRNRVRTNVEAMAGRKAIVTERIDNLTESGHVKIDGMEWMARSADNNVSIDKDSTVIIRAVEGVKLIVEKVPETVAGQTTVQGQGFIGQ
ncbi:NfeD family protein [Butyrivibrio sp. MC2013]|uniref:NfeD family protein n=1 Tax=Butyrivibrio sp. MC2013 TaxID=1280686 RepID=UPI0006869313|nr:NfeD family protein [Butyrivibrio sp. MC2013]